MNVFKSNRRALAVLGLTSVLGAAALFSFAPQLIGYFLVAALLIGLVWIGSHHLVRWLQVRKQRRFDAGVAAREGIEDRKREWASWTAELEQQGIDRYDLPFFLLVGEPQSGKSVLLQNSDLSFPFGQTRLSGIGGTRGCDWWFTEEAVILDLAGRLFTHEGGASDEAEWEAFLGLLASYRPICPANGVMLVIPCDSLLSDSRDEVGRKASKIQDALLTLTSQLQAQLPIYVVLTKGDRIFGFAETVHRLDAEQRHQMFGWSRSAEDYEAPFDMVEVRRAFADLVGRARTLRGTMMSSLRLPEGLVEADRMYAFPDELEAIGPSLEIYLKRIFSESKLVDRLYFRGFYLTSGLQTGAPIANVCAELFGAAGEADRRDLAALFTKQQAYFIKDLVRRRVFSERGLVRPTQARVARARRNAWVGYGLAASLALVSVIWSLVYVLGEYQQGDLSKFDSAIRRSAEVANAEVPALDELLAALDAVFAAQQVAPRSLEGAGVSRTESFEELYCTLCDRRLLPALRRMAEQRVADLADRDPADHAEFRRRAGQVGLLLGGFDPGDAGQFELLQDLLDEPLRPRIVKAIERRRGFAANTPIPSSPRSGGAGAEPGPELAKAARWIDGLWERAASGGDPLQVRGAAGYLVAWRRVQIEAGALEALDLARALDAVDFARRTAAFHRAASYLRAAESTATLAASGARWRLPRAAVDRELDALARARTDFLAARDGTEPGPWQERELLRDFADRVLGARAAVPTDVGGAVAAIEGPEVVVPTEELSSRLVAPLVEACAPATLAFDGQTSALGLPQRIRSALKAASADTGGTATRVIQARCRVLQDAWLERFPSWPALAAGLGGEAAAGREALRRALVPGLEHLSGLLDVLPEIAPGETGVFSRWSAAAAGMLDAALAAAEDLVRDWSDGAEPAVDPRLLAALGGVRGRGTVAAGAAERAVGLHVETVGRQLAARWAAEVPTTESTVAMLQALAAHLGRVGSALPVEEARRLLGTWLEGSVQDELERRRAEHLKALTTASELPSEAVGLQAAARDVIERLTPSRLALWQDRLSGEWRVLDAATVAGSLDQLQAWPALEKVVDGLRRHSARERDLPVYLRKEGGRADLLRRGLAPIRDLPESGAGPKLARALEGLRAERPATPAASVADWYLDELFAVIERKAVARLREFYLADLRRLFEFRDALRLGLYPAEADFERMQDLSRTIGDELERFLGPGGEIDRLRADYRLGAGFEFRPARDEADRAGVWTFDDFLADLGAFVRPDPRAKALRDGLLEIRLAPIDLNRGIWTFNYLFTNFQPGDDHFVDTATLDSRSAIGPLEWRFGADGSEGLWFRWSRSVSGTEQADDAQLRIGSCLAPLTLVWLFGRADLQGQAAATWVVDVPTRGKGDVRARFELRFDRPVPVRPAYPWSR